MGLHQGSYELLIHCYGHRCQFRHLRMYLSSQAEFLNALDPRCPVLTALFLLQSSRGFLQVSPPNTFLYVCATCKSLIVLDTFKLILIQRFCFPDQPLTSFDAAASIISLEFGALSRISPYAPDSQTALNDALKSHNIAHAPEELFATRFQRYLAHCMNGFCAWSEGSFCITVRSIARCNMNQSHELATAIYETVVLPSVCDNLLTSVCKALALGRGDISTPARRQSFLLDLQASVTRTGVPLFHTVSYFFNRDFWIREVKPQIAYIGRIHGLCLEGSRADMCRSLFDHVMSADCSKTTSFHDGCANLHAACSGADEVEPTVQTTNAMVVSLITEASLSDYTPFFIDRVLQLYGSPVPPTAPLDEKVEALCTLRRLALQAALRIDIEVTTQQRDARDAFLADVHSSWPKPPSESRKIELIKDFQNATSSKTLRSSSCACCSASVLSSSAQFVPVSKVNLALLKASPRISAIVDIPLPMADHPTLSEYYLNPAGVLESPAGTYLNLCRSCKDSLERDRLPKFALANSLYLGHVPPELQGLTAVEESIIARCRARCLVVQLGFDTEDTNQSKHPGESDKSLYHQRAIKGNVVVFPQHPEFLSNVMPPPVDDIISHVCILFVGSKMPDQEWLQNKARPLLVRRDRIYRALKWLKKHNCLYSDIVIDHNNLAQLPSDGTLLPYVIELIDHDPRRLVTTSRYDTTQPAPSSVSKPVDSEIPFPSVVVSGVGEQATSAELRSAAVDHMQRKRRPFIAMPHDSKFVSEFDNPALFPSLYPTLFPYGVGGFDDHSRSASVSFQCHVRHLLSLDDTRFQTHPSFLFTAFNIVQRRTMLNSVALKTKRGWFGPVAERLNSVSAESAQLIADRMEADSEFVLDPSSESDAAGVSNLLSEVNSVTRMVCGTSASQVVRRNELRAMNISFGVFPAFVTLNPADCYNPLVKFLHGGDIDIDNLLPEQVPNYHEQSILVAKNPFIAARFFDIYVRAFIDNVLAFEKPSLSNFSAGTKKREGVLGVTKGYYSCVEAQGRGTLHVHMVIWIEGSVNPNVLRQRFIDETNTTFFKAFASYVEDCVSSSVPPPVGVGVDITVPSDSHHPCSVRGVNFAIPELSTPAHQQQDLHNVVKACQVHTHRKTCFKYWKGPPAPQECRFMLGPESTVPHSFVDPVSGEFTLRHVEGDVCFFNDTIIQATHCNMDIKYVASGESAKAIIFYVTDYVTKTQLKMHVSHAALAAALKNLETAEESVLPSAEIDPRTRAKRVLQKCAYEMISKQEWSAPQVASYLMGYGDHYTSHRFRCLYWGAAESYVAETLPVEASNSSSHLVDSESSSQVPATDATYAPSASTSALTPPEDEVGISAPHSSGLDDIDDDVMLVLDDDGEVSPRASQLRDYVYRGELFRRLSFWDHVARSSKIKVRKTSSLHGLDCDSVQERQDLWLALDDCPISSPSVARPVSHFLADHDEHLRSYAILCHPLEAYIPVPVGPALPRRDRPELREKYCRAMLILFKPWRHPKDLLGDCSSWEDAFQQFVASDQCTRRVLELLDNMQVFHECRDSRDDHYRNRRTRLAGFGTEYQSRSEGMHDDVVETDLSIEDEEAVFLDYLNHCASHRMTDDVEQCMNIAAQVGILAAPNMTIYNAKLDQVAQSTVGSHHIDVSGTGSLLEQKWKHEYSLRRLTFRTKPQKGEPSSHGPGATDESLSEDESHDEWTCPASSSIQIPTVVIPAPLTMDHESMMENIAAKWTLNPKQLLAVRILGSHVHEPQSDPLRMYVGGPAGTGKSRVIDALKDLFKLRGEDARLLSTSFMGVAAKNIGGMTLHSALNLGGIGTMKLHGDVHQGMIKFWRDKDWIFVDEVSMVSLPLMYQINEALQLAKESSRPFGGVNVLFAGDFSQLPPVAQSTLYKNINGSYLTGTTRGQRELYGKLLWYSVDKVVLLDHPERQSGTVNAVFVNLLSRLRRGECNDADYALLSTRVLTPEVAEIFHEKDSPWRSCPMIVSDNAAKDAINEGRAIQFALDHNVELHWYYATDLRQGREIESEDVIQVLQSKHSGQTSQRLSRIPICIGMPILVAQNFDVSGGITNGSQGVVKSVRYKLNKRGQRVLTSVVVTIDDSTGDVMPELDEHDIPILCDSVTMVFEGRNRSGKTRRTAQRRQVAIVPAFSMTAHRAQGQSMEHVIVDIESCRPGSEAPYVMLSRATSLNGLRIFRPFDFSHIRFKRSEDIVVEEHRLCTLALKTMVAYGSDAEKDAAMAELEKRPNAVQIAIDLADLNFLCDRSTGSAFKPSSSAMAANKNLANLQSRAKRAYTASLHSTSAPTGSHKRKRRVVVS